MSGTYISKIPVLVVALVIGIVLVTSAVVPLASDYSDAKTFENENYFRVSKLDANSPSYTLTWTQSNNKIVNVNGTDVTMPWDSTYPLSIVSLVNHGIRYTVVSQSQGTVAIDLFGPTQNVISSKNTDATITLSGGVMTLSSTGAQDITVNYTEAYAIDPNGDYCMKKGNTPAYVLGDSEIYATGRTQLNIGGSNIWLNINIQGSIDDGFTANVFSAEGYTISNYTVNDTESSQYADLYTFNSVSFDVTSTGGTGTATYSQVIVPYEVTADPDNPAAYKNLVKVVPLMAFIMLVVAAAGMIYLKNKD